MLTRPTARTAAALLLGTLTLTACTPSSPPDPLPTSAARTESPTPTPIPSVDLTTPPERPVAMDNPGAENAASVAAYFFAIYDYAYATGDTRELRRLSAPSCDFCQSAIDDISARQAAGQVDSGGGTTVQSSSGTEIEPERWYSAQLTVDQRPSERSDASGATIATGSGGVYDFLLAMSWNPAWLVNDVDATVLPTGVPS